MTEKIHYLKWTSSSSWETSPDGDQYTAVTVDAVENVHMVAVEVGQQVSTLGITIVNATDGKIKIAFTPKGTNSRHGGSLEIDARGTGAQRWPLSELSTGDSWSWSIDGLQEPVEPSPTGQAQPSAKKVWLTIPDPVFKVSKKGG